MGGVLNMKTSQTKCLCSLRGLMCNHFPCCCCHWHRLMTTTHLILAALLERAGPGDTSRGPSDRRGPTCARRCLLLLPEQLLHRADVDLVLLLPHRQRPDVGLPAHLLLRYGLPEEAAHPPLLPRVVVGGCGRRGRRGWGCSRRWGRQGRRWGSFTLGGVGGITQGR